MADAADAADARATPEVQLPLIVHPSDPRSSAQTSVLDARSRALIPVQSADPSTSLGMTAGAVPSTQFTLSERSESKGAG